MKVLLFASWYPDARRPGRGIFFKEQAEMLARRGLDVSVIVCERIPMSYLFFLNNALKGIISRHPRVEFQGQVRVYYINKYYLLPSRIFGNLLIPVVAKDVKDLFYRYVRENGFPDILHAHSALHGGFFAAWIAKRHRIPLVVTEHRSNYLSGRLTAVQAFETRYCASHADRLVFVSDRLQEAFLQKSAGQGRDKAITIGNIVNSDFFSSEIHHSVDGPFAFCAVGHLVPIKQHTLLIKAFASAFGKSSSTKLLIIGEGNERDCLQGLIAELGLAENVFLLGYKPRSQLIQILSSCDAFVLTSKHETFGLALAEAAAAGLPCIATNCGGPVEIIDEHNGILVPVGNEEAIAAAMKYFAERRDHYDRVLIRENCRKKFGEESVINRILEVYAVATTR